jgi:hypothetical protein
MQQAAAERRHDSLERKKREKKDELIQKHYGILKRNSARPFKEEQDARQKRKDLEEKLERA